MREGEADRGGKGKRKGALASILMELVNEIREIQENLLWNRLLQDARVCDIWVYLPEH